MTENMSTRTIVNTAYAELEVDCGPEGITITCYDKLTNEGADVQLTRWQVEELIDYLQRNLNELE